MRRMFPGLVALLLMVTAASTASATDRRFAEPFTRDSDGLILLEAPSAEPQKKPTQFLVPTSYGDVEGAVHYFASAVQVVLSLDGETAVVSVGSEDENGDVRCTVGFAGIGAMEYAIRHDGRLELLRHDIADCSRLADSRLYRAVVEAEENSSKAIAGLEPGGISADQLSVGLAYFFIRLAAHSPSLVDDCRSYLTELQDWGVCVVHEQYQDCMNCCEADATATKITGALCTGLAAITKSSIVGMACVAFLEWDTCASRACAGKPGDPHPTPCGYGSDRCGKTDCGTCMFACPQQNAIPGDGSCPDDLVCCP